MNYKTYQVELRAVPSGVIARCVGPEDELLLQGYPSKAEATYAAIRTIDAREIAAKIEHTLSPIAGHDEAINQVSKLVTELVNLVAA